MTHLAFSTSPPPSPSEMRNRVLAIADQRGWLTAPGAWHFARKASAALQRGTLPPVRLLAADFSSDASDHSREDDDDNDDDDDDGDQFYVPNSSHEVIDLTADVDDICQGMNSLLGWASAEEDADDESCTQSDATHCTQSSSSSDDSSFSCPSSSDSEDSFSSASSDDERDTLTGMRPWLPEGQFSDIRQEAATRLLHYFDKNVLHSQLLGSRDSFEDSSHIPVTVKWNKTLRRTAGITKCRLIRPLNVRVAEIELSEKVVDRPERLYDTLAHELCHAAAWVLDNSCKPPHGKVFKEWAERFRSWDNCLIVTTCHSYEIQYRFTFQCVDCGLKYGRHSRSINVNTQACGKCKGRLQMHRNF